MYRKTNPLITALFEQKEENNAPFSDSQSCVTKWKKYSKVNDNFYLLYRTIKGITFYSSLFVFSFPFKYFYKPTERKTFLRENPEASKFTHISDKLKWYRLKNSMKQEDVAERAGIDRATYINYECSDREYYPIDKLKSIADLYNIEVTDLLDDYNLFLYEGQGKNIKSIRKNLRITQVELGQWLDVATGTIKRWEQEKIRISKEKWKKINN